MNINDLNLKKGKPSKEKPWLKYYDTQIVNLKNTGMNIYDLLKEKNKDNQNGIALNYFGKRITFNELFENIDITVEAVKNYIPNLEHRIIDGEEIIISIAMPSTPETIYLFFALARLGIISNMIDPRTSEEGIIQYVKETNSEIFVGVEDMLPKLANLKRETRIKDIITISPSDSLPLGLKIGYQLGNYRKTLKNKSINAVKWADFFNNGKKIKYDDYKYPVYYENMPVTIVHTGGTTGIPKGVILTHDNLNSCAFQCINAGYWFERDHKWLNIMPPFIAYGVGNGLLLPLLIGMETILIPKFEPEKFFDLIYKYGTKPNVKLHITAVPSHFEELLKNPKLKEPNNLLNCLIEPTVGGNRMEPKVEKEVNELLKKGGCNYPILKGYGLSEVNAAVCACISPKINKIGSVGIPYAQTIISAFSPDTDKELNYGEIGEICIHGPNTMLKYYDNEEDTNKMLRIHSDGKVWVHSGDLGYIDEDGFVFLVDRIKRMIIRADGFKIHPSIIEDVISKHEKVKNCIVVGIPDLVYEQGMLPKAHIVLKDQSNKNISDIEKEIIKICKKDLPEYMQPAQIQFDNKLPLTNIGKVDYLKIANLDAKSIKK